MAEVGNNGAKAMDTKTTNPDTTAHVETPQASECVAAVEEAEDLYELYCRLYKRTTYDIKDLPTPYTYDADRFVQPRDNHAQPGEIAAKRLKDGDNVRKRV